MMKEMNFASRSSLVTVVLISAIILLVTAFAESVNPGSSAVEVKAVTIHSEVMNEDRVIRLAIPEDYNTEHKYPVVFVLDARANAFIEGIATSCEWAGNQKFIVVGIDNVNRSRDMFPVYVGGRHTDSGGARKFLSFITGELMPYVDSNYSTSRFRVLMGFSNSAVFTLYAMLEEPDSFEAFVASSPMIGYCPEYLTEKTRELFSNKTSFKKILFMNQGESDSERVLNFLPGYAQLLKDAAPKDFQWTHVVVEGGGHVPAGTECSGLKFVSESYSQAKQ